MKPFTRASVLPIFSIAVCGAILLMAVSLLAEPSQPGKPATGA